MWKKSLIRGLCSFCISVTITVFVGMIAGLCGAEFVCTPDFVARVGSSLTAAYLQPIMLGLIGFAFGAGSVLFEIERWSFLKQGTAHLAITAAVWIPIELICFSPVTPPVVFTFTLSAATTYAITWSVKYFVWRAQVKRLNSQIHRMNGE